METNVACPLCVCVCAHWTILHNCVTPRLSHFMCVSARCLWNNPTSRMTWCHHPNSSLFLMAFWSRNGHSRPKNHTARRSSFATAVGLFKAPPLESCLFLISERVQPMCIKWTSNNRKLYLNTQADICGLQQCREVIGYAQTTSTLLPWTKSNKKSKSGG